MVNSLTEPDVFESGRAFDAIVEHWSRSMMDSALATIARYDDAAKQLIAVAGALQGLYFAAFAFGDLDQTLPWWWAVFLFVPVLAVIFIAAQCVCRVSVTAGSMTAYRLLETGRESGIDIDRVTEAVDSWCGEIDTTIQSKRFWLHLANLSFVVAAGATLVAVLFIMSYNAPAPGG
jgi:hypothetical protein